MPSSESEPQYEWVDVDPDELARGDMARGLDRDGYLGGATPEGYVRDVNDEYVYFTGSDGGWGRGAGWDRGRQWQRRVPAPEPTGWVHVTETDEPRWDSVTLDMLTVGDRVRVTHQRDEGNQQEADVVGLGCSMGLGGRDDGTVGRAVQLVGDGGIRFCAHRDTWDFERLVTEQTPGPVLAAPRVGDRFTRVFDHAGYADRAGCVVRTVRSVEAHRAQPVWAITYDDANGQYWHLELLVRPDGTCSPSVLGYRPDTGGRYVPEVATEVFNPFGDLPFGVVAHDSGASAGAERALPSWATSLDAARRYVHEQAIDLWRAEHNCWDGTRDFLDALDLPTEKDWPEADESAEIRNFLTEVREAALDQAEDHGKDSDQVRAWLRERGIVPAPPALVQHEFTVLTGADVNVRQILLDLGWVVQD